MKHHIIAWVTIAIAIVLDVALGIAYGLAEHIGELHGLYCALASAVTVGGDISPVNGWGYLIMSAICLTVVPLFAASFSLFTSALADVHIRRAEKSIKDHVTEVAGLSSSYADARWQESQAVGGHDALRSANRQGHAVHPA